MGWGTLTEKIIAGIVVAIVVAIAATVRTFFQRRRRYIVKQGGENGQTFVSAGLGTDKVPDILVQDQNGQMRIRVETQPLGHVVFRFMNPKTNGLVCSVIVMTSNETVDLRDFRGAQIALSTP
jgi:hypothetical protein